MLLGPMEDEGENLAVDILILPLKETVHRPEDLVENFSTKCVQLKENFLPVEPENTNNVKNTFE